MSIMCMCLGRKKAKKKERNSFSKDQMSKIG
jgi:hypothetical protein